MIEDYGFVLSVVLISAERGNDTKRCKVDAKDSYHRKFRLRTKQIAEDTECFLKKWGITYLIEKLPGGEYSKKWDGKELVPVRLRLDSDKFKNDIVVLM
jgi:hypothetical protein